MTEFKPNPSAVRDLARSSEIGDAVLARTEAGRAFAEAVSPRDTGEYADSWVVEPDTILVDGMPRAGARLVNTAPHAPFVEWVDGYAVAARAMDVIEGG